MNYSKIIYYDTANCHGFSTTIWVSGCERKCKNCFNPELQDKNYGKLFTEETFQKIILSLKKPFNNTLVILGGEPLNYNRKDVLHLCKRVKTELPNIIIIIYTGYTLKELQLTNEEGQYIDYLIDGPFEEDKKPQNFELRGSINQRCWCRGDLGWYDFSEEYFKENNKKENFINFEIIKGE